MTEPNPPHETDARAASWSRYWASGALHSCPGSFQGNYAGAMATYWLDTFAALPAGARVLDLCTGNGAIPRWLMGLDGGTDRGVAIDAIDLATIKPEWVTSLQPEQADRCRFHANTSAESLPFSDATFDLVTSQYGIEYADLGRVFAEISRVSKPGARLQMLMHHAGSRPVRMGVAEAGALMRQLSGEGLFAAVPPLLDFLAAAGDPAARAQLANDAAAERSRAAFNQAQRALAASMTADPLAAPMLDDLRAQVQQVLVMAQQGDVGRARLAFRHLVGIWQEAALRIAELVSVAADEATMQQRCQQLAQAGFDDVSMAPLSYEQHLMGWAITATRRTT